MPRRYLVFPLAVAALAAASGTAFGQTRPPFVFTSVDLKLLAEANALDQQFEKRALVYHDAALEKHLAEIAAPLLPAAPLEHVDWRFHILRDPTVNAFALPNGSVYVNAGLLARAENDDQVAGVLAHEATHVINHHAYIFNRSLRKKIVAMEVGQLVAWWLPVGGVAGAVIAAAADASEVALVIIVYGYSRELEEEADTQGIAQMKQAARDPAQMVRMFSILDEKLEPEPAPLVFRTHPRTRDRIAYLKKTLGTQADLPVQNDAGYVERMRLVILQSIQLDWDSRRFRSAVAGAERLVAARPDDAVAVYSLGESWRLLGPREPRPSASELTDEGQRAGYRQMVGKTEEEDTRRLAKTPEGAKSLEQSQRRAEELLVKTAGMDRAMADAHFSLGALYQQEAKGPQAVAEYRKYIGLVKEPAGQERAKRRIAEIEGTK